jgi:hypothetical protein
VLAKIHNRIREQAKVKNTPKWERKPREYIQDRLFIRTKNKQVVPLTFNPIQAMYWEDKTTRDIILKPRQLGFSTLTIGRFFECVINEENVTAVIIAHDADSTQKMFQTVQLMYERLPESKKEQLNNGRNKPKYGNKKEFFFQGNNSRIYVGTAGSDKFGRSQTINYLLCSEVAFWPNPEELMTGLLQAVPYEGEIVIESTANGVGNYYYQTYTAAKEGLVNWRPHFYSWFQHPEYQLPITSGEEIIFDEEEKELVAKYSLTPEQIKWRRWKISEMPDEDGIPREDRFKQEYPSNDDEAFLMTGTPVYDAKKVIPHKQLLEARYKKRKPWRGSLVYELDDRGMITRDSIKMEKDPHGMLLVYEMPQPGYPYVIGGDIAEGGHDMSVGQVRNNVTWNQAATWRGRTDTDLYAKQMYCLGILYNVALIGIETNFDTHPVKELDRLQYPRQYVREVPDTYTGQLQKRYGFHTSTTTRPPLISKHVGLARDHIVSFNDMMTLSEMLTFVRNKVGKPEALAGKHDDTILADAIALAIREQQDFKPREVVTQATPKLADKLGIKKRKVV